MKIKASLLGAAALLLVSSGANGAIVYSNDFNAENGGVSAGNYNGFNGLSVTDGTVDVVRSGDSGITCPGGTGSCVDLDGSSNDAGVLKSGEYAFAAGDKVTLSFDLTGNQRGGSPDPIGIYFNFENPTTIVNAGFSSAVFTGGAPVIFGNFPDKPFFGLFDPGLPSDYGVDSLTLFFTAANAGMFNFSFESEGRGEPPIGDNVGLILDNVSLDISAVPEPASWAMMIGGFAMIGAATRRRQRVTVFA